MRALLYLVAVSIILLIIAKYAFLFSTWLQWNFSHESRVQELVCSMVKSESLEEKERAKCTTIGQK